MMDFSGGRSASVCSANAALISFQEHPHALGSTERGFHEVRLILKRLLGRKRFDRRDGLRIHIRAEARKCLSGVLLKTLPKIVIMAKQMNEPLDDFGG